MVPPNRCSSNHGLYTIVTPPARERDDDMDRRHRGEGMLRNPNNAACIPRPPGTITLCCVVEVSGDLCAVKGIGRPDEHDGTKYEQLQ